MAMRSLLLLSVLLFACSNEKPDAPAAKTKTQTTTDKKLPTVHYYSLGKM